jgi:cellulose synthase/poly-beta-1,6-N-acetylglucosamine synthase-like glycosyltransferase
VPSADGCSSAQDYRVSYRSIHGTRRDAATPALIGLAAVAIDIAFVWWLFSRAAIVTRDQRAVVIAAEIIIICSIGLIEVARLIQAISLSLASVIACDPIAPPSAPGLRAALLTTIVPDQEPLAMVTKTLAAAKKVRYPGLRVWLLDEGDAKEVRETCRRLKVKHFSRLRTRRYNTPTGRFEVRTKHGNLNAWLDAHGADYDVILCLDPDHIPNRDFAERVMGYFNDPNVAYVVGPQFYGNVEHFVSRAAESQQFPFHSVIQRAGNRYRSPMLVGTNNAIRVSALRAAGGFVASITEDVATGLVIQSQRNPATGDRWESVYVPDVLAIGEGPASWADYFGQQARWSRGGIQAIGRTFLPRVFRLRPKALLQYLLITSFYPTMALGWLLGAVNAGLFIVLHARGIIVPIGVWAALYTDTTVFQLWVYMRARRHNVSPFDRSSSGGPIGMAMTVMAAPIYAGSFLNALAFRRGRFRVTPKGKWSTGDSWRTFRRHLCWSGVYLVVVVVLLATGSSPAVLWWPVLALLTTSAPPLLWRAQVRRQAHRQPSASPAIRLSAPNAVRA